MLTKLFLKSVRITAETHIPLRKALTLLFLFLFNAKVKYLVSFLQSIAAGLLFRWEFLFVLNR